MRIVAGTAKGRTLKTPRTQDIRPTADRVRESLFNVLGQFFEGGELLDLYAGTGAFALEALSRGISRAVMVDSGREALALCRENTQALGFDSQVEVLAMPAARALERLSKAGRKFSLVFADPPYALRVVEETLTAVGQGGLLAPDGTFLMEHDRRETAPDSLAGLSRVDQRAFGDTQVSFYRSVP
jgi:16S rRNA (guanine966-N2)-methyltransferase